MNTQNPAHASVRTAHPADMPAITRIYAREVVEGIATFEYDAPGDAEMMRRYKERVEAGYPSLVAEVDGEIAGYAYAGPFHARPGYRFTVEDTIYLAPAFQRMGVGTKLLNGLINECTARGYRQMLALIGDSANAGSIGLHRRCGFVHAGNWTSAGWKFGRWIDVVVMQRALGDGDDRPAS